MQVNYLFPKTKSTFGDKKATKPNPYEIERKEKELSYEEIGAEVLRMAAKGYKQSISEEGNPAETQKLKEKEIFLAKLSENTGNGVAITQNIIGSRICFQA